MFEDEFKRDYTVRKRVAREDGDEHLFDWHTVVVLCDGNVDENLAALAAKEYSLIGYEATPSVSSALDSLTSAELEKAFVSATGEKSSDSFVAPLRGHRRLFSDDRLPFAGPPASPVSQLWQLPRRLLHSAAWNK